jgi:hypothetical protein
VIVPSHVEVELQQDAWWKVLVLHLHRTLVKQSEEVRCLRYSEGLVHKVLEHWEAASPKLVRNAVRWDLLEPVANGSLNSCLLEVHTHLHQDGSLFVNDGSSEGIYVEAIGSSVSADTIVESSLVDERVHRFVVSSLEVSVEQRNLDSDKMKAVELLVQIQSEVADRN